MVLTKINGTLVGDMADQGRSALPANLANLLEQDAAANLQMVLRSNRNETRPTMTLRLKGRGLSARVIIH